MKTILKCNQSNGMLKFSVFGFYGLVHRFKKFGLFIFNQRPQPAELVKKKDAVWMRIALPVRLLLIGALTVALWSSFRSPLAC